MTSFITALVADGAVIVVTGIAERRRQGDKVKQGSVGPDGVNVTFEDSIAEAVEQVNDRVDRHVADLNQALRDVERGFNERLVGVERALSDRIRTIEQSGVVPSAEPERGEHRNGDGPEHDGRRPSTPEDRFRMLEESRRAWDRVVKSKISKARRAVNARRRSAP